MGTSEMAQWVKTLATKPDNLTLKPRTHPHSEHGERREVTSTSLSSDFHMRIVAFV